ncbi:MAG TPA: hypothetical protein VJ844_08775 [Mucilaginibacter sp.]|nr:hypothetical protein [Mucilaginibacter sp.]
MKNIKKAILGSYSTYNALSYTIVPQEGIITTFNEPAYNVNVDDNTQINILKQNIQFKNDLIGLNLVNNRELLNCLIETVSILSNAGMCFVADLDILKDEDETKFLLVYYPIEQQSSTSISSFEEYSKSKLNYIYTSVIRNLYKYPISIKKSVIIDEQPI